MEFDTKNQKRQRSRSKLNEKQAWLNENVSPNSQVNDKGKRYLKGHFTKQHVWPVRSEKSPNEKKSGHRKV